MSNYIIYIGANRSGSTLDGIEAGKKLGYSTILLTNIRKYLRERELFPEVDEMFEVDIEREEEIRKQIHSLRQKGKKIACIISFLDDYVYLAAKLSNEYCGTDLSLQPIADCLDKTELRSKLKGKAYSPIFFPLSPPFSYEHMSDIPYPVVLKSPVSNGSKDVLLIQDEEELQRGIARLSRRNPPSLLVEEYLDGPQYLIETVIKDGTPIVEVVVKQEIDFQKRFIVTGYSVSTTHHHPGLLKEVRGIISDLGFENGSCHLEMRLVQNKWRLVEINPRVSGGSMNKMIAAAYGLSIVEETLRVYLKKNHEPRFKWEKHVYTSYMTVNKMGSLLRVTGVDEAEVQEGIIDVHVKPNIGKILRPPTSMAHRYGYVMAVGKSVQESEIRAKNAANLIKFYIEST
ncbi:ATP-grasp domain-containing protein [Rossellomorea aquimaris]|uniref:ATP-grasp domain-containing protein n=1 Tax=Rossellomorea aquimaris TaxID=189382 RepID=UPI001CD67C4F|nr:ATP-grasp domain-containing protein [Rossellomorea aquimaris]MCA1057191.1 ATP-grasp domain-containing protein [Rossellomorea aquimaris]